MSEEDFSTVRTPKTEDRPYFSVARATAQDRSLSWEARGVLFYLLSKPDDWEVQIRDLQQNCGRDKVKGILKELVDAAYLKVVRTDEGKQLHDSEGHFTKNQYQVYETPFTEKPLTVNPSLTYKRDNSVSGRNEWYDAIFAIWKYTGAMNGAMQKMLQGTSKRKGWQEYNLSIPLASAEELLKWARWYRATQLGGRSDLNMLEERLKIQSSIHYWQTIAGMPDAPAKPAQDTLFSDAPVPADDFDTMLKFMGVK